MSLSRRKRTPKQSVSAAGTIHDVQPVAQQLPLPWPFSHEDDNRREPRTIFTIGHSSQEGVAFLNLLGQHGVQTLVDVRSAPYSRYAPHFSRAALEILLGDAGVRYVWAGDTLGGRPDDPACYHNMEVRPRNVNYRAMARRPVYQQGVRGLLEIAASGRTVIMCSEEDPRRCHRHRLIERSLRELDVAVLHIRRDGSLETIDLEEPEAGEVPSPQLALKGFAA